MHLVKKYSKSFCKTWYTFEQHLCENYVSPEVKGHVIVNEIRNKTRSYDNTRSTQDLFYETWYTFKRKCSRKLCMTFFIVHWTSKVRISLKINTAKGTTDIM